MLRHCYYNLDWFAIHAVDHCNKRCQYCNNHSPFMKRRNYSASEYIPHLIQMLRRGIRFDHIRIAGGEPFLHPDLLGFAKELRQFARLTIASNLFWLKDEASIDKYAELLSLFDTFFPSLYPDTNKMWLVKKLEKMFPDLSVVYRPKPIFLSMEFTEEPMKVKGFCSSQGDCVNLLIDGRLSRCATGAFADTNPNVTEQFLKNRNNMFFDLYKDENIAAWREKWPLDSCSYCTLWKEDKVQWQELSLEE